MTQTMLGYLATAMIFVFCIPVFGWIMNKIILLLYSIVASFLGNQITYILFNKVTFVGVFHHELSHALLATITGAKVKEIVFFHPQGNRLGYVKYQTRGNVVLQSIQNTMTSIAPVFCGALTVSCLYQIIIRADLLTWQLILLAYCVISVLLHMTMSGQDFKVMWKGIPVVYIIILIILITAKYNLFEHILIM